MPFESVFFGTLASIAGICAQSYAKIHDQFMQPLSLFIIYSGLPGSNKSSAISIQKHAFSEMEIFCQIVKPLDQNSKEDMPSSDYLYPTTYLKLLARLSSAPAFVSRSKKEMVRLYPEGQSYHIIVVPVPKTRT